MICSICALVEDRLDWTLPVASAADTPAWIARLIREYFGVLGRGVPPVKTSRSDTMNGSAAASAGWSYTEGRLGARPSCVAHFSWVAGLDIQVRKSIAALFLVLEAFMPNWYPPRHAALLPPRKASSLGTSSQESTALGVTLSLLTVSYMSWTASTAFGSAMVTVLPSGARIDPPLDPMNSTRSQTSTSACLACQLKPSATLPVPVSFCAPATSSLQDDGGFMPAASRRSLR